MRTVKYQAWIGHTMIQVTNMNFMKDSSGEYNGFIEGYYLTGEQRGTHTSNPTKSTILREYTGLKDKNGKEIYEGDLIKVNGHHFEELIKIDGIYEVMYNGRMELCAGSWLLHRLLYCSEINGNIYENPELLEGTTP